MAQEGAAAAKQTKQSPIRRERTLTLIGALIVFVTFVGKDAMREHYKEEADSILSAVNRFSIIQEVERHGAGQQTIALGLMYDRSGGALSTEMLEDHLSVLFEREINSVAEISTLKEVLKRAPEDRLKKRLDETTQRLKALSHDRIGFYDKLSAPGAFVPLAEQIQSLSTSYDKIEVNLISIGADVRTFATERLESAERRYRWWTWASYFLYAIGWGLAVYARLRGFSAWGEPDA